MKTSQILKIVSIPALFIIAFVFALFPRKIQANPRLLSILNILTGGVFLGLSLCHMLAESHESLEETIDKMHGFPLSYFLAGCGFFLTLFMEQIAHALSESSQSKKDDLKEVLIEDSVNLDGGSVINGGIVESSSCDKIGAPEDDHHGHHHGHAHGHHEEEGHHGHSHLPPSMKNSNIIAIVTIWIALSFHSIMEGIALGTSEETALFVAIVGHKAMDAIAVGAPLARGNVSLKTHIAYALSFSAMSPLGVLIGMLISHYAEDNVPTSIVSCLAAGTFLYVGIVEITLNELAIKKDKAVKLIVLFLGFVLTSVLAIWC